MAQREDDVSKYESRSVKIMYMPPSQDVYIVDLKNGNSVNSSYIYNQFRMAVIKPHGDGRLIGYDDGSKIYLLGNSKLYSYSGSITYTLRAHEAKTVPSYIVSRFPSIASQAGNNIYSYMDYNDFTEAGAQSHYPIGLDWQNIEWEEPTVNFGFKLEKYVADYRNDIKIGDLKGDTYEFLAQTLTNDPKTTPIYLPRTGTDGDIPFSMISFDKYPLPYPQVSDMDIETVTYNDLDRMNEYIYDYVKSDLTRWFKIDNTNRSISCGQGNTNRVPYGDLRYTEEQVKAMPTYIFNLIVTSDLTQARKYITDGTLPDDARVTMSYPGDDGDQPTGDDPDDGNENGDLPDDVDDIPVQRPSVTSYQLSDTHFYRLTVEQMKDFYKDLWSLDISDVIVNQVTGIYGSLIENVLSLRWFPIKSSDIGTNVSNNPIKVGYVTLDVTGYQYDTNNKINHGATFDISKSYNSYMDYAPYTDIQVYLPFYGMLDLDTNLFMSHTLNIDYTVDVTSGLITYYISRNGTIVQQVQAKCAIDIPMTLSSMIDVATQISQNVVSKSISLASATAAGNPIGMVGSVLGNTSSPNMRYLSGIGDNGALYGNRQITIFIKHPQYNRPGNYASTIGFPSYGKYKLSNLSGLCVVDNPRIGMTDKMSLSEYDEIISLLQGGIFI